MRLRLESFSAGHSTAVLFEGQLHARRKPSGVFDRHIRDIETPLGLPISIEALYDAGADDGRLVIRSGEVSLVEVSPLSRGFQMILSLPSGEELCIAALADV